MQVSVLQASDRTWGLFLIIERQNDLNVVELISPLYNSREEAEEAVKTMKTDFPEVWQAAEKMCQFIQEIVTGDKPEVVTSARWYVGPNQAICWLLSKIRGVFKSACSIEF